MLDGRGDIVALVDSNGTVVDKYSYDIWGNVQSSGTSETVAQRLRYGGYWYDSELTWYWASIREYSPALRRWMQPDPSGQDSIKCYKYVADDPVDSSDPSGECVGRPTHINYWCFNKTLHYMWQQMVTNARSPLVSDIRSKLYEASHPTFANAFVTDFPAGLVNSALLEWAMQVRARAPWDHKPILNKMLGLSKAKPHGDYYFPIPGDPQHECYYDIWSNIHFGYVGSAAGLDGGILKGGGCRRRSKRCG